MPALTVVKGAAEEDDSSRAGLDHGLVLEITMADAQAIMDTLKRVETEVLDVQKRLVRQETLREERDSHVTELLDRVRSLEAKIVTGTLDAVEGRAAFAREIRSDIREAVTRDVTVAQDAASRAHERVSKLEDRVKVIESSRAEEAGWNSGVKWVWALVAASPGLVILFLKLAGIDI